jgi:hypothetical protein
MVPLETQEPAERVIEGEQEVAAHAWQEVAVGVVGVVGRGRSAHDPSVPAPPAAAGADVRVVSDVVRLSGRPVRPWLAGTG